jgi:hypothetical protein
VLDGIQVQTHDGQVVIPNAGGMFSAAFDV